MIFAQISVNLPDLEKAFLAAGPPAVIATILLIIQIRVIANVEDRKRRSLLLLVTTTIQATVLTLWALAWALGTFQGV